MSPRSWRCTNGLPTDWSAASAAANVTRRHRSGEPDVVLSADDESEPEPDYVSKIVEVYERDPDGLVGGVGGSERDEETVLARGRLCAQNAGRPVARRFVDPKGQGPPSRSALPEGVADLPVHVVRSLHGAKMSFRADL